MILKNNYKYGPYEGYQLRIQRRIQVDLGVTASAAEIIMNLRNQVIELQRQVNQIEVELAAQHDIQNFRLASDQEILLDVEWIELDIQE